MLPSNTADFTARTDRRDMTGHKSVAEFARYFAVSGVALVLDASMLLVLAQWVHYLWAASISFVLGSILHYLISIRLVFNRRRFADKPWFESSTFFGAGIAAMLINGGVIYSMVEWLTFPLLGAKLFAAGASFVTGFVARKWLLFR